MSKPLRGSVGAVNTQNQYQHMLTMLAANYSSYANRPQGTTGFFRCLSRDGFVK